MGRKSHDTIRKNHPQKKQEWVRQLFPYWQQHGIKEITMDDVAQKLGKSKATIYKYFQSKEEILHYTVLDKIEEIRQFEGLLTNQQLPYLARYFAAVQHLYTHVANISNVFLADLKHQFPPIWEVISDFQEEAANILKSYYEEGIQQGIFHPINPSIMVLSDQLLFAKLSDPDFLIQHQLHIHDAFQAYFRMKFLGIVKDQRLLEGFGGDF